MLEASSNIPSKNSPAHKEMRSKKIVFVQSIFSIIAYILGRWWLFSLIVDNTLIIILGSVLVSALSIYLVEFLAVKIPITHYADEHPTEAPRSVTRSDEHSLAGRSVEKSVYEVEEANKANTPRSSDLLHSFAQELTISPFEEKRVKGLNARLRIWPSSKQLGYQLVFQYQLKRGTNHSSFIPQIETHVLSLLEQTDLVVVQKDTETCVEVVFPEQTCPPDAWMELEQQLTTYAQETEQVIRYHLKEVFPVFSIITYYSPEDPILELLGEQTPSRFATEDVADYLSSMLLETTHETQNTQDSQDTQDTRDPSTIEVNA